MTDGADSPSGSAASRSGLDRVARELRELQDDLARLGEHTREATSEPASPSVAPAPSGGRSAPSPFPAPEAATTGDDAEPDGGSEAEPTPAPAAPAAAAGEDRPRRPLAPPVSEVPHASQQLAKAIVDDAFAQAERILADAQLRNDDLRGQVDHLIGTRDRLQEAANRLIAEFERAISELRRPPRPPSTGV